MDCSLDFSIQRSELFDKLKSENYFLQYFITIVNDQMKGDLPMNLMNSILIVSVSMVLLHPVAGEVTTLSIATDSSWKCLDFENAGWTSNNYDDSWWESADTRDGGLESGQGIWYPGDVAPAVAYFRNAFEIGGSEILNGKLHVRTYGGGTVYLYINDNPLDKMTVSSTPVDIDITSYLKPGKNVIAAKVDVTGGRSWALIGTIRYDKSASGQPIT
jgi:hypothetical protein